MNHMLPGLLAVTLIPVLLSCSHLKLGRRVNMSEGDWPTYARDASRSNMTTDIVAPPLSLLWTNDVTGSVGSGSPIIADGLVIVGTLRGEIHVLDLETGDRLGWTNLGDAINGSPVISGSVIYVAAANTAESIVAFNLETGATLWKKEHGDVEVSLLLHDDRLYFGNTFGEFFCLNRSNGETIWKFELTENQRLKGVRSSPALEDSTVVFGCDDGNIYALNARTGDEFWRFDTGEPVQAPVCAVGGSIVVGNSKGKLVSIDIQTGTLKWETKFQGGIYAGVGTSGNMLIAATTGGVLAGIDQRTGERLWTTNVGSVVNAAPVVSGRYAYFGSLRKIMYCVDISDGSIVFEQPTEGRIKTPPAVAFGKLFVATDERYIMAFTTGAPE